MTTFFTILFILIGLNAMMMVFSLNTVGQDKKKPTNKTSHNGESKIYPIDILTSELKKAV